MSDNSNPTIVKQQKQITKKLTEKELAQHFKNYDLNNDSRITEAELQKLIQDIYKSSFPNEFNEVANKIIYETTKETQLV